MSPRRARAGRRGGVFPSLVEVTETSWRRRRTTRRVAIVAVAAVVGVEAVMVGRRRGTFWSVETVVRCRSGHLFTTWWIPGMSVKAVRLGWWRFQRCPVGPHWSLVTPAWVARLGEGERQAAAQHHDARVP